MALVVAADLCRMEHELDELPWQVEVFAFSFHVLAFAKRVTLDTNRTDMIDFHKYSEINLKITTLNVEWTQLY